MLIRSLSREHFPYNGWTQSETDAMQNHIHQLWLPTTKAMLAILYHAVPEEADRTLKVFKVHMTARHATEGFMSLGGLTVRPSKTPICSMRQN